MYEIFAPLFLGLVVASLVIWILPKIKVFNLKLLNGVIAVVLGSAVLGVLNQFQSWPNSKQLTWYLAGFLFVLFFYWALNAPDIKLK